VPYGRGRNYFGRGFWKWGAAGPAGPGTFGRGLGGRGNPYPYCRRFPWLPRWWWAVPQYAGNASRTMVRGWGLTPGIWQPPGQPTAYRGW
jgi:hypothetical protein